MIGRVYVQTAHGGQPLRPHRNVRVLLRAAPFDRGPRKNVLVEPVWSCGPLTGYPAGTPYVRPFRGLRSVR